MVDIVSAFFYAMPSENNKAVQETESLMPKTCVISEEKQLILWRLPWIPVPGYQCLGRDAHADCGRGAELCLCENK